MEGKQRDTSNKPAPPATLHPGEPRPKARHPHFTAQVDHAILEPLEGSDSFRRLSPELYRPRPEYWNEGGLRMTAEFVVGLVTCVATVAGTVIAALSYFKDKE